MNTNYKPEGYNSVSAYLIVDGAQKLIALLEKIFKANELRRFEGSNGKIMHSEIKLDDSVIMIADSTDQFPPNQHLIHVFVPNVEEVFEKADESGCEIVDKPAQKEGEPNKRGSFKDFGGNIWAVATQMI